MSNDYTKDYNFKRLCKEGEKSWDDVIRRFINELVARGAKTPKEDLEWLLLNYYALPNSPALLTAGNKEFYASACSSVPVFDTMDGHPFSILDMLKLNSMLTKKGVGTGVNFSKLRSKEEPVGGKKGTTGGPVSFLRAMSSFTSEITQATRKSAAMGTLSVHHPDIKEWIACKQKDGEISGFNLSVLITDDFMEAVEKDEDYELKYPHTGEIKKVKSREVFDLIANGAFNNGEPAVIYTGNIDRDYYKKLGPDRILNNPCLSENMRVLTSCGIFKIKDIINKDIEIYNGNEELIKTKFIKTGEKEVYRISFKNGFEIEATKDHIVKINNKEYTIDDLILAYNKKERIKFQPFLLNKNFKSTGSSGLSSEELAVLGFFQGDSCLRGKGESHGINFKFNNKDKEVRDLVLSYLDREGYSYSFLKSGEISTEKKYKDYLRGDLGFFIENLPQRNLPLFIFKQSSDEIGSFLRGLFSANGCVSRVNKHQACVSLKSTNINQLKEVQLLLTVLGIKSNINKSQKEHKRLFRNGIYTCKGSYRLVISKSSIRNFYNRVGFIQTYKNDKMKSILLELKDNYDNKNIRETTIESVENIGYVPVYDYNEPETHYAWINGMFVHNCQEFIGTYDETPGEEILEMCVLGSIDLTKYANLPELDRKRVVETTTRLLNDIIDTQNYVSPMQERGMKKYSRKIGIGFCGLSTTLAIKSIKYSSNGAYEFVRSTFAEIGRISLETSQAIYKERCKDGTLIDGSPLHELKRFNVSLLSNAPTSTLANIFNDINKEGCSYGAEPYFTIDQYVVSNSYGKWDKTEKIVKYLGEEKAKEIIECANDLDWRAHVRIVEAIMESNWGLGINQSVSKTVNFKNNITVDEVKEAIMYCWKNKIKGISFYRDGSRKNQVISTKDSYKDCVELDERGRPKDIFCHQSPKRPEFLDCDIYHTVCDKKNWLVLVGLFKGKPYEVFAGLEENISIPKKYKNGKIQKKKGYHLVVGEGDDELIIKDIPHSFQNPEFATLTRITSFSLRHGGPLKFVIEQLQKEGGFDVFNKAIARVLKKYIVENESIDKPCPNCGGALVYISGCPTCTGGDGKAACGYSRCS